MRYLKEWVSSCCKVAMAQDGAICPHCHGRTMAYLQHAPIAPKPAKATPVERIGGEIADSLSALAKAILLAPFSGAQWAGVEASGPVVCDQCLETVDASDAIFLEHVGTACSDACALKLQRAEAGLS